MNYTISLLIMILGGAILGYLFGSILFAVLIGKLLKQIDVREIGSNNPGFTNSKRVYGKKISFLILILDISKSVLPTIIFYLIYRFSLVNYCKEYITQYYDPMIFIYLPGMFGIIGHIFPIFFRFKGGKGIASYGGLCICLSPFIALIGILIIIFAIKITKKMSIGTIIATILIPFMILMPGINYLYLMYPNINDSLNVAIKQTIKLLPIAITLLLLSSLVVYRHKKNIINLLNKKELTV